MTSTQTVASVVTVNFNGRQHLARLLPALLQQSYGPAEIVVVDNGSTDGSAEFVAESFPGVRVLALSENLGFAAGNNVGILGSRGRFVALINNDTVPDRHWLKHLVSEIETSSDIGAVGSKILFLTPFVSVKLGVEVLDPAAEGISADHREMGVLFDEASGFLETDYKKPIFHRGFLGTEKVEGRSVRRTESTATLFLPVAIREQGATLRLIVSSGTRHRRRRLTVRVGDTTLASFDVEPGFEHHDLQVPEDLVSAEAFDVINNAGSRLSRHGNAGDRGIEEADRGQYDTAEDVEAVCGAAVLFRRSALEKAGLFDPDFFMYYEDTDLSWRLRESGYRLRYQPRSVTRHVHAASSVAWSPMFNFYTARNKVLMIAKNGSFTDFLRAYAAKLLLTLWFLARWLGVGGTRPRDSFEHLVTYLKVQGSLAWQIPRAFLKRWRLLSY